MKKNIVLALGLLVCNAQRVHGISEVLTGASSFNSLDMNELRVFNGDDGTLLREADYAAGNVVVFSSKYSPKGTFVAAGGVYEDSLGEILLRIYANNVNTNTLAEVASFDHGSRIDAVDWSPKGGFIAIAGIAGSEGYEVRVLSWDGTTLGAPINFNNGEDVRSIAWSPDGKYLAIGDGTLNTVGRVRVLAFNGSALTLVDTYEPAGLPRVRSVDWSPNGQYVAVGTTTAASLPEVRVLAFDSAMLTETNAVFEYSSTVFSVDWSPDGAYIAVGGQSSPHIFGPGVRVLRFADAMQPLEEVASFFHGPAEALLSVLDVAWYPDCSRIAMGGSLIDGVNLRGLVFNETAGSLTEFFKASHGSDVLSVDVHIFGVDVFDVNLAISNCHKLLVNDICPVLADCPILEDPNGTTNLCGNVSICGPESCLRVNTITPVNEETCEADPAGTTCFTGRVGVPCLTLANSIVPIKDCKEDFCGNLCLYGCVTARNDFKVLGHFTRPSDERIKHNITPIDVHESLAAICALQPQSYEYTKQWQEGSGASPGTQRGFIAQQVASVLPELVHTYQDEQVENLQAIDYSALVVDLVGGMQALREKVTNLQQRTK